MNTRRLFVQQFCRGLLLAAGAVFCVPLGAWADLPAGYAQIDYIQSSGTQWIDTGYLPKTNTCLQADWQFIGTISRTGGGPSPIGCSENSSTNSFSMNISTTSGQDNKFYTWFDKGSGKGGNSISLDVTTTIRTSRNTFTLDAKNGLANYGGVSKDVQKKTTTHSVNTFVLFGSKGDDGTVTPFKYCGLRLFGFKIYEGETLVRDFVPCAKRVGTTSFVAGLYDMAHPEAGEASFYANQGTGNFLFVRNGMEFFATPAGAGTKDGSSWTNAVAGLDPLTVGNVFAPGDKINLAVGTYPVTNQLSIVDCTAVELRGGYAGTDDANPYAKAVSGETRLTVVPGKQTRHLYASKSSVTLDDITFTGGNLRASGSVGASVSFSECAVLITNCLFTGNTMSNNTTAVSYSFYGGAIYVSKGSLVLSDSVVSNNVLYTPNDNSYTFGSGAYLAGVDSTIRRTVFVGNEGYAGIWHANGAALCFNNTKDGSTTDGGRAIVENCDFLNNFGWGNGHSRNAGDGSGICATDMTTLDVSDCRFIGNRACGAETIGGVVRVLVIKRAGMVSRFTRCVFKNNGFFPNRTTKNSGSISLGDGTLEMVNCLVAGIDVRSSADSFKRAIDIRKGTATLSNCTITDNKTWGVYRDPVYGRVDIVGSIIYSNTLGSLSNVDTATYSCIEGGFGGDGNFSDAPLLSGDGYYHPLSAAGRLTDGYFSGTAWTTDAGTSTTIDKGDAGAAWYDEPQPNNLRVNIGYDANTGGASKSATGDYVSFDTLTVVPLAPTNIALTSACAMGVVGSLGGEGATDAAVTLVWDTQDRGTADVDDWEHSRALGTFGIWAILSSKIDGLVAGQPCVYRIVAVNSTGTAWSSPAISFTIPVPPVLSDSSVSHLSRTFARLCVTLTDDGAAPCSGTFSCWPTAQPASVTSKALPSLEEGVLNRVELAGLTAGTAYSYQIDVVNVAGTTTRTGTFTTLATTVPLVRYVTPEGAGIEDGTSWENAYAGLVIPLSECLYAGDTVYMRHGTYDHYYAGYQEASQLVLQNAAGLSLFGGYTGEGTPGALAGEPTIICRNSAATMRLLRAKNSTLRFDNVTFRDGLWTSLTDGGGALRLESCTTVLANCVFDGNRCEYAGGGSSLYGGAIYATAGSLSLEDCDFATNRIVALGGETYSSWGGAIAVTDCAIQIRGTDFVGNWNQAPHGYSFGGAVYAINGSVSIASSTFLTNSVNKSGTHTTSDHAYGGALAVRNAKRLNCVDSTFVGNYAIGHLGRGGTVFLDCVGAASVMTSVVARCVFDGNGTNTTQKAQLGSVHFSSGVLYMTNCLVSRAGIEGGLVCEPVKVASQFELVEPASYTHVADIVNVTFADNARWGFRHKSTSATANLRNCIAWGTVEGGVSNATTVVFTDAQDGVLGGAGNISGAPLFVDAANGNYRLKSRSPCGNVGDRTGFVRGDVDLDGEPRLRGGIDLGCYESCDAGGSYIMVR